MMPCQCYCVTILRAPCFCSFSLQVRKCVVKDGQSKWNYSWNYFKLWFWKTVSNNFRKCSWALTACWALAATAGTRTQCWCSAFSLKHRWIWSPFMCILDDEIFKENVMLRNIILELLHNLYSFADWRTLAHLYFWETLLRCSSHNQSNTHLLPFNRIT